MKKFLLLLSFFCNLFVFSQIKPVFKEIDSIYQKKWDNASLDIDSLDNPVLVEIPTIIKRDSLVILKDVVAKNPKEIPVTPFNLIHFEQQRRWFFYGENNLVFNQSSFSNWNSGGNNTIGIIAKTNYNLSFKKDRHYLENIIQLGYGFVNAKGQSMRKTEDYINLMTNYGYELGKNYYLSTGFQFLSQFTAGYNYDSTPKPQYNDRVSKFMAPAYLNFGLGISYNPRENFQIIFRPANAKFTFVTDPYLQKAGRYGLQRDGQSLRKEIGAMMNILYRLNIYKDISFTNQLNFFANYLYHIERVDINYSGILSLKFNKFISGMLSLDLLYDHDQIQKLQVKQTLGLGFVYNWGNSDSLPKNKKSIKPFIVK